MSEHLFLCMVALVTSLGMVFAADLTPATAQTAVVSTPSATPMLRGTWNGGYVGVQLSYGSADADDTFGDHKSTGGFYGALTGYRYDAGRFVVGGEFSYDRTDVTFPDATNVDNLLRAGASLGYDLGRFLPYVSGGYAGVSLANDQNDFDDTYHGGFYGVGIAYQVTDHVLIGGDVVQQRLDADGIDVDVTTFSGKIAYRF